MPIRPGDTHNWTCLRWRVLHVLSCSFPRKRPMYFHYPTYPDKIVPTKKQKKQASPSGIQKRRIPAVSLLPANEAWKECVYHRRTYLFFRREAGLLSYGRLPIPLHHPYNRHPTPGHCHWSALQSYSPPIPSDPILWETRIHTSLLRG